MTECSIVDDDGTVHCTCDADAVLRLLAESRRRAIVAVLDGYDDNEMRVENLAATLSTVTDRRETATWKTELHHVHLPSLEDGKIVDYDRQRKTVRYYECDLVSAVLDATDAVEIA
ncbi:ArsR family transcriptional regulator [Halosolutus amylolyticus]|uniref:ArsR family transcriptional regulator n=1 Tax=Halosolutus amylolyticus TaxID=2932267 RepID=A0ABD5PLL7_9EURY|nr:ArsR family transcriptional regulator [Halosolutus amylolyticus]